MAANFHQRGSGYRLERFPLFSQGHPRHIQRAFDFISLAKPNVIGRDFHFRQITVFNKNLLIGVKRIVMHISG
ncbi:MAG: hypothetical protein ABIJ53_05785 [Verrucomicrobiota bacterium]